MKKTAVVGTRTFEDKKHMYSILDGMRIEFLITGEARGADKLARDYAYDNDIPFEVYVADWNSFGKSAGPMRNNELIKDADEVIAFWDGNSVGTKNTIKLAKKKGIPIYIHW